MKGNRKKVGRAICGALLLALLAACGFIGANQQPTKTVSVATTRTILTTEEIEASSVVDASAQLAADREREIALLDEVLANEQTDAATRENALSQKTQIAERMENEAQTLACLRYMGFEEVAVVCGAQMMTVIVPYESVVAETDRTRLIDAVCSQTGFAADSVKIILSKK